METDQGPLGDLPLVPEDGDLHARVIEVMTDIEGLLDVSSVVDVFALSSARRKRVEVNERKMTESDRKVSRKATGWSFNHGLIIGCSIWSRKIC